MGVDQARMDSQGARAQLQRADSLTIDMMRASLGWILPTSNSGGQVARLYHGWKRAVKALSTGRFSTIRHLLPRPSRCRRNFK